MDLYFYIQNRPCVCPGAGTTERSQDIVNKNFLIDHFCLIIQAQKFA
jgi:hypothetical protein